MWLRRNSFYHFCWLGLFRAKRHQLVSLQFLMHRRILVFLVFFSFLWISIPQSVSAQDITPTHEVSTPVAVTPAAGGFSSPENGATLSGAVEIRGTAASAWDLSFSYTDDPSGTWFTLAQSTEPVSDGILGSWDTTSITDGSYILRLDVSAADGLQDFRINVRVRNYSVVETPTAAPTLTIAPVPVSTQVVLTETTVTTTYTPGPSPTIPPPLPPNPATLDPRDITVNFGKGVFGVVALFLVAGLLLFLGRKLHS
jgi:hypothetical protein